MLRASGRGPPPPSPSCGGARPRSGPLAGWLCWGPRGLAAGLSLEGGAGPGEKGASGPVVPGVEGCDPGEDEALLGG